MSKHRLVEQVSIRSSTYSMANNFSLAIFEYPKSSVHGLLFSWVEITVIEGFFMLLISLLTALSTAFAVATL